MWYLTTHYTMSCHHTAIIKYSGVGLMTSLTPSYLHTHYQSSYVISNYTLHHVMSPYSHHQILWSRADDITNTILSTHLLSELIWDMYVSINYIMSCHHTVIKYSGIKLMTSLTPSYLHTHYQSSWYVICIHTLHHVMSPYSHHQVLWSKADDITNTILSTQSLSELIWDMYPYIRSCHVTIQPSSTLE